MDVRLFVDPVTLSIAGAVGLAVGSFLNVLIFRARTGMTKSGRSMCLSCGKKLTWMELVPVVSYLVQGGRCRGCDARISVQYPLVELSSALLAVWVAYKSQFFFGEPKIVPVVILASDMLFWWAMLAIFVYDLRHKIIPDSWVALGAVIAFLKLSLMAVGVLPLFPGNVISVTIPLWVQFLSGPALAAPFALLWVLSSGRSMGLGDAKLIVALGWFLGVSMGLTAVILSFWIGGSVSLVLLLLARSKFNLKSEIPFAPFLIGAALLVYMTGIDIMNWSL